MATIRCSSFHWVIYLGGLPLRRNSNHTTPPHPLYWCPILYLQWISIPAITVQQASSDNPVCTIPRKIILLQNGACYLLHQKLFKTNIHESGTNMHWKRTGRASWQVPYCVIFLSSSFNIPWRFKLPFTQNINSSHYLCVGYIIWPSQKRYAIIYRGIYFHLLWLKILFFCPIPSSSYFYLFFLLCTQSRGKSHSTKRKIPWKIVAFKDFYKEFDIL